MAPYPAVHAKETETESLQQNANVVVFVWNENYDKTSEKDFMTSRY